MEQIIKFDANNNKKRKTIADSFAVANAEFEEAAKRFEESDGDEGLAEFLNAMGTLAKIVFSGPEAQEMMKRADEREKEFLKKNQDIINNEPKFDEGLRMQYYAKILLDLANKIFHTEDGFSQPFDNFAYFMEFYDSAFSKYSKRYPDLEEEYHFTGELTYDVAELERMVMECLEEVIQLKPNDSDKDKTRLLYHGSRLFELYRNMLYYSSEKREREK